MNKPVLQLTDRARSAANIRLLGDRLSFRINAAVIRSIALLLILGALFAAGSLMSGKYEIPLSRVGAAFLGHGDDVTRMIVLEWRLPRVVLAGLLGASLGMSGAIFQSLTRNPLGSPDVIGFSAGSHTGALTVILLFSGGYYETAAGALVGGVVTASLVYLLAWQRGIQGFRLIIVGIGIAAMLSAFNAWMIREADLQMAMSAAIWGSGSLNGLGVEQLPLIICALAVLIPSAILFSRPLRQLEMGDDVARASGVSANSARLTLMVLGVAFTAIVTATAGPISFISLVSPQIARRLARSAGLPLVPSALMGGLLLIAADWAAQHAFAVQLPVGVMTVSIGGIYFILLLVREGRK